MPTLTPWEKASVQLFRKKGDTRFLKEGQRIIKQACEEYAEQYLQKIMEHLDKKLSTETLIRLKDELRAKSK